MPSAPRGKGYGKGSGGLSDKQKACPIARPSRDYQWKIENREYGEDVKETREEQRKQEADARDRARETGAKVDLGAAGDYWEKVADTHKPVGQKSTPFSDKSRGWDKWPATATSQKWQATDPLSHDDPWGAYGNKSAPAGAGASWRKAKGESCKDFENGKCSRGDSCRYAHGEASSGKMSGSWAESAHDAWAEPTKWEQKSWSSTSAAPIGSSPDRSERFAAASVPSGPDRAYTTEDKAQRAEQRRLKMESRQKTQDGSQTMVVLPRPTSNLNGSSSSAAHQQAAWAPAPQGSDLLKFEFASCGLTDENLEDHCKKAVASFRSGDKRAKVIDVSENQLTAIGFSRLVDFLCAEGVVFEELRLHGNCDLRIEPGDSANSLWKLMDFRGTSFGELHLQTSQLEAACCWKLCGIVKDKHLRRLCFHDENGQETEKQELLTVFQKAVDYNLKIAGLDKFAAACGLPPLADRMNVDEAEADLVLDVVYESYTQESQHDEAGLEPEVEPEVAAASWSAASWSQSADHTWSDAAAATWSESAAPAWADSAAPASPEAAGATWPLPAEAASSEAVVSDLSETAPPAWSESPSAGWSESAGDAWHEPAALAPSGVVDESWSAICGSLGMSAPATSENTALASSAAAWSASVAPASSEHAEASWSESADPASWSECAAATWSESAAGAWYETAAPASTEAAGSLGISAPASSETTALAASVAPALPEHTEASWSASADPASWSECAAANWSESAAVAWSENTAPASTEAVEAGCSESATPAWDEAAAFASSEPLAGAVYSESADPGLSPAWDETAAFASSEPLAGAVYSESEDPGLSEAAGVAWCQPAEPSCSEAAELDTSDGAAAAASASAASGSLEAVGSNEHSSPASCEPEADVGAGLGVYQ